MPYESKGTERMHITTTRERRANQSEVHEVHVAGEIIEMGSGPRSALRYCLRLERFRREAAAAKPLQRCARSNEHTERRNHIF